MNKRPDELWEVISIRPFGDQPRGIEHVTYKHSKESADEYVAWLGATQYNRGTVQTVTKYIRADSPLIPKAKWIHIDDQLPETNTDVLFTCMYEDEGYCSDVQLGWYEGAKTLGDAIVMETSTDKHDWYPCTHWMPLPKTPEIPQ